MFYEREGKACTDFQMAGDIEIAVTEGADLR